MNDIFSDACYVIQHRDHSKNHDRTRNLIQVLKYVRSISKYIEILIIEQDTSKSSELETIAAEYNVKYEFLYNPGLFNRSWGFNFSTRVTDKQKLVFADNDMLIDNECFIQSVTLLDIFSIVRPYNGYSNDLTEEQTLAYISTKQIGQGIIRNIHNLSGGVILFNKTTFEQIGMFDERFEGWGGEDDEMMLNIQKYATEGSVTVATLNHPITHLYHSREIYDGNSQPNYNKNVSYITDGNRNFGIIKLGDVNKYRGLP